MNFVSESKLSAVKRHVRRGILIAAYDQYVALAQAAHSSAAERQWFGLCAMETLEWIGELGENRRDNE